MRYGAAIADYIMNNQPTGIAPTHSYTVKPGDSLSSIAGRLLGDISKWREIWNLNSQITDPNRISIGQVIKVPAYSTELPSNVQPTQTYNDTGAPNISAVSTSFADKLKNPYVIGGIALAGIALIFIAAPKKVASQV